MGIISAPEWVSAVLRRLSDNGYGAYLVGGCVRDTILKRAVHDWDIATSAPAGVTSRLFERTVLTGARYGTVRVIVPEGSVEVTTFREDGEYLDGRRPESVRFTQSLEADLSRRDFTINAIAVDVQGEIYDLYDGINDIRRRIIRSVGAAERRFGEDALRMLRAYRFSAELSFKLEAQTEAAIHKLGRSAAQLSSERVCAEVEKTLMSGNPHVIGEIINADLLTEYICTTCEPRVPLTFLKNVPKNRYYRWSALCFGLLSAGYITDAGEFLRELRLDKKVISHSGRGAELAHAGLPQDRASVKRLLSRYGEQTVLCAAAVNSPAQVKVEEIINSGECYTAAGLALTGDDLLTYGHRPGRALGSKMKELLEHVIEHPEDNTKEKLSKLV